MKKVIVIYFLTVLFANSIIESEELMGISCEDMDNKPINDIIGNIIVDQTGSGDYLTIQDAIDNSIDGDVINVMPGNYTELLIINKEISLVGTGRPLIYHVEKDTINVIINSDNNG